MGELSLGKQCLVIRLCTKLRITSSGGILRSMPARASNSAFKGVISLVITSISHYEIDVQNFQVMEFYKLRSDNGREKEVKFGKLQWLN